MPNRIVHNMNSNFGEAEYVREFYTKSYLTVNSAVNHSFSESDLINLDSINMYYKIAGYELYDNEVANREKLQKLSSSIVNVCNANKKCFSTTFYNSSDGLQIIYGANYSTMIGVRDTIKNNLYNTKIENTWINKNELVNIQKHNGCIVGCDSLEPGDIDVLLNSMGDEKFILNIISIPCFPESIEIEIRRIDCLLEEYERVQNTEILIGTNRGRHFNYENQNIANLVTVLKNEKNKLLLGRVSGFWKSIVHIASNDYGTYKKAAAQLSAIISSRIDIEKSKVASVIIDYNYPIVKQSLWKLPNIFAGENDYGGIYGESFFNLMDSKSLASFITLPILPHKGFRVLHVGETSVSTGAFDRIVPETQDQYSIEIGALSDGQQYKMKLNDLRQHLFVTGTTRYGKSTTVQKIITSAYNADVPFVVLEAVKKEYWKLKRIKGMENIQVLSSGMDSKELFINPFEPEENTLIDSHIQNLVQALLAMFEQTDPIPQIIKRLVYMCYKKHDWNTASRTRKINTNTFPKLSDMLENLNESVEGIGYSTEVQENMKGVIRVRIESLIEGQSGKTLNTTKNISVKDMFEKSTIVELDDFAEKSRNFVAALLAIKANEYSKQCKMDGKLNRLLVVEEAHHILPNPELRSISINSKGTSKYFSDMLAEISAYGTGVVIVEQRASIISAAALANSGTKVIHNIRESDDIKAVSGSMGLKDYETALLNKLNVGEAIISVPQDKEICRVAVNGNFEESKDYNLSQLICGKFENSASFNVTSYEKVYIKTHGLLNDSIKKCIESIEIKELRKYNVNEKMQIAGRLSDLVDDNVMIKRQILFEYYSYLKDSRNV